MNRAHIYKRLLLACVCAASVFSGAREAAAQTSEPADIALPVSTPGPVAETLLPVVAPSPTGAGEATAAEVYQNAARYLGSLQSFFVEINSTTTLSSLNQTRKTGGLSRVWYRRPAHVVWTTQSDIGSSALALNGETCTLYLPSLARYKVSMLDGAPDSHLVAMAAPYGLLASSFFASDTTASLRSVLVAEPRRLPDQTVLGVPCRGVVVPTASGDTELWVASGVIPLPVKLAYSTSIPAAPGENNGIESRTEVSFRWRVNVDLPDTTFQLQIPPTAVKMERLGAPVVVAKADLSSPKRTTKSSGKASSRSSSRASSGSKKPADAKSLGLAFDPPPDLDKPLVMRSALERSAEDGLPSLQNRAPEARDAVQGAKPDAVSSGASYQPTRDTTAPPPPSSAAKSPSTYLKLMNGRQVNLGSYRGKKAVVLDFWATWCGPCQQSMPIVNQVAQAYRDRGVEFFAVNMAENETEIQSFVRQKNLSLPVALDPAGALAKAFGVTGIPHLVVIGKDGTIKGTHTGADSNLQQKLTRDLDLALQ